MADQAPTDPDRHPLDLISEEFAERCRRGEHPTVSDYVRRHPDLADGLRTVLPPIALMEKLKRRNTSSSGIAIAPMKLERLGDFKIVREIGRGGMGIVYEAWQESLGRHVALKVLSRASLLDPQRLARFEREAKAAAGLHHTNIVPVFGVGTDEGLHYYVMQFIDGRPLSDLLGELSGKTHPGSPGTGHSNGSPASGVSKANGAAVSANSIHAPTGKRYWTWVANIGRQVADAMQYAHKQGVLHRDIKPANLLLDAKGIVWVADFGLAKLPEMNDVTQTGDIIGTLQYMAPEGLKSQLNARSDVYALGLTLHELLTLRPAFSESSPAALMRRLSESSPTQPRRVNPHIPRDLETIVLKATARDPSARYASAGDLAQDLDNFLHDRPVMARRVSPGERMWRWCRRNKAVASFAAAAMLCAVAAIVTGWVAYGTTRRALASEATRRTQAETAQRQAETAKHQAEVAERRAEANVALSLKSFEEIFNRIAPQETMPPPAPWPMDQGENDHPAPPPRPQQRASSQDAAVLQSVLNFYDRFAKQNSTNLTLELEAAKAYRRVGDIYLRLGRSSEADAANRRSMDSYAHLLQLQPDSAEYQAGFVDAASWVGFPELKATPENVAILQRASQLAEKLLKSAPADPDYNMLLARTLFREGAALRQLGQEATAEQKYRQSIKAWERRPDPRQTGRRFPPPQSAERAAVQQALAELMWDQKRTADARKTLHEEFDELNRPSPGPPRGRGDQTAMKTLYARLAQLASKVGDGDLNRQAADRASHLAMDETGDGSAEGLPPRERPPEPPPRRSRGEPPFDREP